jgi:hypothetical protein
VIKIALELADRGQQILEVRGEVLEDRLEDVRGETGDQAASRPASPEVAQEMDGNHEFAQAPLDVIEPRRALGTRTFRVEEEDVRHVPS